MRFTFLAIVFLFFGGVFSVVAQDVIVLRDGNFFHGKVYEISPTEIRYKRIDNLDGPMIVIPAANVLYISYENGTTELIDAAPIAAARKTIFAAMDPGKLYFSLSADPSGFLMYGPLIQAEFTKNHFNAQVSISFPSIGLLEKSKGFAMGIEVSINYMWYTKIGPIYLGGLFGISRHKFNIPGLVPISSYLGDTWYTDGVWEYTRNNYWGANFTIAANLGYKFIFSSGLYINLGASLGAKISFSLRNDRSNGIEDIKAGFSAKPNISFGYKF
ncbi:MAG: hypothetical protein LBI14_09205 [Treponema sp.]|jgi:hypothetical protein|nr:hypothetical protein [Treponema sp.]